MECGVAHVHQAEGKVDMIGVSNVESHQLQRARAVTEIVSVQNRHSLDDRDAEEVLATCEQIGVAFLPWSPLAGSLTREAELQAVAIAPGATAPQVAIAGPRLSDDDLIRLAR
jgi:pyridoxine 4-dehydrogenase